MRLLFISILISLISLSLILPTYANIHNPNITAREIMDKIKASSDGPIYGIDTSTNVSLESWKCLLEEKNFVISAPRCYRSSASIDPALKPNLQRMKEVGYTYENTHAYFFPSIKNTTKSVVTQWNEFWDYLQEEKLEISMIWLDFEVWNPWWFYDVELNKIRATQLLAAVEAKTQAYGIYSNLHHWTEIFGSPDWIAPSNDILWYSHFDNLQNCSDFKPFGQFTKPVMKQYTSDNESCDAQYDVSILC